MMYPEELIAPMRTELTDIGFEELKDAEAVDRTLKQEQGTTLLVINSVCGCAGGAARPAVKWALENSPKKPDRLVTVFAGADIEAVNKAREHALPYPPSSPSIGLFKDGELVHFIERHDIKGYDPENVGERLAGAMEEFC